MFGRNSESPIPVIACATPSDCFDTALEAARIAIKYRTPVFLLSDAYLANGSEPWLLPDLDEVPPIDPAFAQPNGDAFQPYERDEQTLARPWAIPGTAGLEHRIGGLEKADVTGNVSYDPENHDRMTRLRAQKVAGIAQDVPELYVDDPDGAETLVLSWGGTYGPVAAGVRRVRANRKKVAHAHFRYLNPFPRNTGEVVRRFEKILVPEINLGQLVKLIRAEFLVDATGFNLVRGIPFRASAPMGLARRGLGRGRGRARPPGDLARARALCGRGVDCGRPARPDPGAARRERRGKETLVSDICGDPEMAERSARESVA